MRPLQRFCAIALLTLAVVSSALANDGHIDCGLTGEPLEPVTAEQMADGHIDCGLTQAALTVIQTVLALS